MSSANAKETILSKLGFKSSRSSSKVKAETDRLKKENAHFRKKLDRRHVQPPESDKNKLLQKIVMVKEQAHGRQQLTSGGGENGQQAATDVALLQDQLRDALEKNQQWLVYDQQREAYVQSVLAHTRDLEQQLAQANQHQAKSEPASEAGQAKDDDQKKHLEPKLAAEQKDLEITRSEHEMQLQKEQARAEVEVSRLQNQIAALQSNYEIKCREMSSLRRKYDVKSKDLGRAKDKLKGFRNRHAVSEERKVSSELTDRMRIELETVDMRLEGERKRSAELLLQVNMLQKSLLSQKEQQKKITALEQIQLAAKEFETEKIARQSMQQLLNKVLKELRKKTCHGRISEPSSYSCREFEHLTIDEPVLPSSQSKVISLLDKSFLDCPKCHTLYRTSRHRELLEHIDYCMA